MTLAESILNMGCPPRLVSQAVIMQLVLGDGSSIPILHLATLKLMFSALLCCAD